MAAFSRIKHAKNIHKLIQSCSHSGKEEGRKEDTDRWCLRRSRFHSKQLQEYWPMLKIELHCFIILIVRSRSIASHLALLILDKRDILNQELNQELSWYEAMPTTAWPCQSLKEKKKQKHMLVPNDGPSWNDNTLNACGTLVVAMTKETQKRCWASRLKISLWAAQGVRSICPVMDVSSGGGERLYLSMWMFLLLLSPLHSSHVSVTEVCPAARPHVRRILSLSIN